MPLEGSSTSSSRRFCISELGQDLYLGEMDNDTPDGFGLTVEEDGKIVYGMMKDGIRQGIGMICYDADMWEVGKWTEGNFKSFNNSRISQAKLEAFKRDNREYRKEMRGMLLETTFNLAQVGLDIAASVKGNNSQELPEPAMPVAARQWLPERARAITRRCTTSGSRRLKIRLRTESVTRSVLKRMATGV